MEIEVLHIDECPSWSVAAERVREALDGLGLSDAKVETRLLRTPDEARVTAFAGSPTITLGGDDLFPSEGRTADLACRVYMTDRGLAGMPTTAQIAEAIRSRI